MEVTVPWELHYTRLGEPISAQQKTEGILTSDNQVEFYIEFVYKVGAEYRGNKGWHSSKDYQQGETRTKWETVTRESNCREGTSWQECGLSIEVQTNWQTLR